ncbi:glutathione peroxidase [Staphylococcus hyicus]|uniref:Glutathione peroxidase n=2 Tax=Staphylococcus hyicus TaxID=1284 RepID=A0ACD5FM22_STAHY|nr:glutathione peroxidase [Staphylococcus hyicus]MCQ9301182.1 glutathione peroxidase [Staphylococcus hyicus]MDP4462718.1 glutathione peroxidase [Staphylococcus hyicus]MDP4468161.1 glutathione peroxidase [Staphylococcus hyicus]NJH82036.1 redoxin domain-containing protein [Staphylococcus hyicus]PTJ71770.1 glutathione peroxidase [Staphylococcus hyicus]
MQLYDIEVEQSNGDTYTLSKYKGDVMLIVNTASECGFTPQFKDLQTLYEQYKDQGFIVLGFPCNQFGHQEPGSGAEATQNCQLNYGVTFPMHQKIEVNGTHAHPLFQFLKSQQSGLLNEKIKWNFTKFLIDRDGNVVKRFSPQKQPLQLSEAIESLL